MFEYTKDNHLKFDIGVSIGRCSRPVKSFKEECVEAAKLIASKTDKRIFVAYNNNISSQVVCLAFREAGINFTAVMPRMVPNNFNQFNYVVAKDFFKRNKIQYKAVNVNLQYYFTQFAPVITAKYKLPTLNTLLFAIVQTHLEDGILILNDKLLSFDRRPTTKDKQIRGDTRSYSCGPELEQCSIRVLRNTPFNYYYDNQLPVVPEFFAYTPELLASFYLTDEVKSFINMQDFVEMGTFNRVIRPMLYKKYFNIEPIMKYDGIEMIDDADSYKRVSNNFRQYNTIVTAEDSVNIPYTDLVEYLTTSGENVVWKQDRNDAFFLKMFKKR